MHNTRKLTEELTWIGANDRRITSFEGVYKINAGMSYNSYFLDCGATVVFDTVDKAVAGVFFENIEYCLNSRSLDYIVVHHMEPDHSATLATLLDMHSEAKVICNAKIAQLISQFYAHDVSDRLIAVKDGDCVKLGTHEFKFIFAPMVHWPEVMVTYDSTDKVLFSADGFGKFGAFDVEEDWDREARRYYIGIVGKYGPQVQKLLKAAATLDIQTICPLHGPILTENLGHYLEKYDIWSSYKVESEGVMIAYTSVYGHTKKAAELLAQKLEEKGCPKVVVCDLAREDMAEAVEDAFRYGKLVLASITYNGEAFPFMRTFIENLTERNYQNRTIGLIENGSWAPTAAKVMKGMFEKSKNITWLENNVKIMSSLSDENVAEIDAMAEELCK